MTASGTYVYCIIANPRRPRRARVGARLPHGGPVRLLAAPRGLWVAVSTVPLEHFGEGAIAAGLADIDWVSRVALAHDAVAAAYREATAVLPMALFTIFADDERVLQHVADTRGAIDVHIRRVARHDEWGVRIVMGGSPAEPASPARRATSGTGYLQAKRVRRTQAVERATRARDVVAGLFDELSHLATDTRRRTSAELPAARAALLLDAAMLVPRSRSRRFRACIGRAVRTLGPQGYQVTLTGPWPPYSFLRE